MAESTKIPLISLSVPTAGGGFVQLAVWENEQQKDGEEITTHSCTLHRRYRDGDDWKSTHSFRAGDLFSCPRPRFNQWLFRRSHAEFTHAVVNGRIVRTLVPHVTPARQHAVLTPARYWVISFAAQETYRQFMEARHKQ